MANATLYPFDQIPLPSNNLNLCWFDSVNVALFHKPRPEIDRWINSLSNINEFTPLTDIYKYYSGKLSSEIYSSTPEIIHSLYSTFQNDSNMMRVFNTSTFTIHEGQQQDVGDYMKKLTDLMFDHNIFINDFFSTTNSFFIKNQTTFKILDIDLTMKENIFVTESTNTLIFDTGIYKVPNASTISLQFLETITLPLKKNYIFLQNTYFEPLTFLLDSAVIHTGGAHYFCFLRARNEESGSNWTYYNDTEVKGADSNITTKSLSTIVNDGINMTSIAFHMNTILNELDNMEMFRKQGIFTNTRDNLLNNLLSDENLLNLVSTTSSIINISTLRIALQNNHDTESITNIEYVAGKRAEAVSTNKSYNRYLTFQEIRSSLLTTYQVNPDNWTKLLIYSRVDE